MLRLMNETKPLMMTKMGTETLKMKQMLSKELLEVQLLSKVKELVVLRSVKMVVVEGDELKVLLVQ